MTGLLDIAELDAARVPRAPRVPGDRKETPISLLLKLLRNRNWGGEFRLLLR